MIFTNNIITQVTVLQILKTSETIVILYYEIFIYLANLYRHWSIIGNWSHTYYQAIDLYCFYQRQIIISQLI